MKITWMEKLINEELVCPKEFRSVLKMLSYRNIDGLGMFSGMILQNEKWRRLLEV